MPSSAMLRRVALARTDVSEECIASIITEARWVSMSKPTIPRALDLFSNAMLQYFRSSTIFKFAKKEAVKLQNCSFGAPRDIAL
jgi:hypothetical protein